MAETLIDKANLIKGLGEEEGLFYDSFFNTTFDNYFLSKSKNLVKRDVKVVVTKQLLQDGSITPEQYIESEESSVVDTGTHKVNYAGEGIKASFSDANWIEFKAFLQLNDMPKRDTVQNVLAFVHGHKYIIYENPVSTPEFVHDFILLYSGVSREDVIELVRAYASIEKTYVIPEEDLLKLTLSLDTRFVEESKYDDAASGWSYYELEDVFYSTFDSNSFNYLLNMMAIFSLGHQGKTENQIRSAVKRSKVIPIINSTMTIQLNADAIQGLIDNEYLRQADYSLTVKGSALLATTNYIIPRKTNIFSSYYVSLSQLRDSSVFTEDNFVSASVGNTVLFGLKENLLITKAGLGNTMETDYKEDKTYSLQLKNSIGIENKRICSAIGYTSNLKVSENSAVEICHNLFNGFEGQVDYNFDAYNVMGGWVVLKTFVGPDPIFVNSLLFRFVKKTFPKAKAFVSTNNTDYILFYDGENRDVLVAVIKASKFSCAKEYMGTYDYTELKNKIKKNHPGIYKDGINFSEIPRFSLGYSVVQKAEIEGEDLIELMSVSFANLKQAIHSINSTKYLGELDEQEILETIIDERSDAYAAYLESVRKPYLDKMKALRILSESFRVKGNEEKVAFYTQYLENYQRIVNAISI